MQETVNASVLFVLLIIGHFHCYQILSLNHTRVLHGLGRAGPENLRLKMGRAGPHPQWARPGRHGTAHHLFMHGQFSNLQSLSAVIRHSSVISSSLIFLNAPDVRTGACNKSSCLLV